MVRMTNPLGSIYSHCGLSYFCNRSSCYYPLQCEYVKTYSRLLAIEDILGDEYDLDRFRELVKAYREERYIVLKEPRQAGVHRLSELAQADREGRCVVLDVKIGQKVWILDAGDCGDDEAYPLELNINGITLSDEHEIYYFIESPLGMDIDPFSHKDIGKTVFLTRADAEAALRREQENL